MRQHGVLKPLDSDDLPADELLAMVWNILSDEQRYELEEVRNVDFAWEAPTPDGAQHVRASCMSMRMAFTRFSGSFRTISRRSRISGCRPIRSSNWWRIIKGSCW